MHELVIIDLVVFTAAATGERCQTACLWGIVSPPEYHCM